MLFWRSEWFSRSVLLLFWVHFKCVAHLEPRYIVFSITNPWIALCRSTSPGKIFQTITVTGKYNGKENRIPLTRPLSQSSVCIQIYKFSKKTWIWAIGNSGPYWSWSGNWDRLLHPGLAGVVPLMCRGSHRPRLSLRIHVRVLTIFIWKLM